MAIKVNNENFDYLNKLCKDNNIEIILPDKKKKQKETKKEDKSK